ncbi:hypothetical protein [Rhizoctonia solani ambivirus 1]|uniref:Uncharacterized protein n=1 Tax=Rhizoctonia solani ambivirus 1 TaxID=2755408 RepID=A0A7D7FQ01_9VIRU|nr:hypothetical protein [Rhizoctonia solani ambivirus 1]
MPVKLITPFDDMPLSYDLKHVPEGHGVFFRYFSELAKFDFSTIPSVINRYFLGCLADDEEDAQERFANIKQGYGIIAKTETGKILSHLFFCIDLSLRLQTTLRVVIHNGIYCGVVMLGTGYTLRMLGRDIVPQRPEVLKASYLKASPHANALDQIFQKLDFGSDEQKQRYLSTTNSMWDLKRIIQGVSVIGGSTGVEAVKKLAKKLYFPGEVAVPASANGIQSVLRCISDGTKDISTLGYLHHSYLFSEDRVELAFAAFGGVAPSFRVPTGRHMKINEAFRVTSKDRSGNVTTRDVNKISAHLVPLEVAIKEFRDFMRDKTVFNVFGNQVVHTSDSAIFKTYKDEGFIAVLGALREVAGVTTVDTQSGGKKRKADDDAEGGRKKKKYVEEF